VIIERRRPELRLGVVVPAVAVIILGLAVIVYIPIAPLVPALRSYWLVLHVLAAALSGACFILTGVISARYLIDTRRGRPADSGMPAALDRLAFRLVAFAFPIWTFGALIAGPIWAEYAWGRYWGWDPKEVWALVTWIVFAAYLHARATAGWRGRRAAVLAIVGAVSFVFNYIGVNLFFAGLHSYAGI
jgi:cytochrome c-type biogenesis protein CcsB